MKTMLTSFFDILIITVRHAIVKLTETKQESPKKKTDHKKRDDTNHPNYLKLLVNLFCWHSPENQIPKW